MSRYFIDFIKISSVLCLTMNHRASEVPITILLELS
jgi:hypothetical protein